jgi:hypothetical protein
MTTNYNSYHANLRSKTAPRGTLRVSLLPAIFFVGGGVGGPTTVGVHGPPPGGFPRPQNFQHNRPPNI